MNSWKKYLFSAFAFLGLVLWNAGVALAQCPMCKAAVESNHGSEPNPLAEGLNTGILYLFVLPYLSIMLIGFIWYRGYRKRKKERLEEDLNEENASKFPPGLQPKESL